MLRHCVLERAVYELPSLDDTIGQHPLAIPMKFGMVIESARLVRFHNAFLPLDKGAVDPFARQYCIRLAQLDQLPVPYASAQFANELAAAVKRSEDAFAAGTTRREVSLPTVALCVHENAPALLFP